MPLTKALALGALLALSTGRLARADDPCDAFSWDLRIERALFAREGQPVKAAADPADAPALAAATPYAVALVVQEAVHFSARPGKKTTPTGARGGLAKIHVTHAGRYRISLDSPAWIDAVVAGEALPSQAFQGRPGCNAPHKVVEYELREGDVVIQLSAALTDSVRLTITETPRSAH